MPGSRQCLILLSLFFATASATVIRSFDAKANLGINGNVSTIYSNMVELWADVIECPDSKCVCEVASNTSNTTPHKLEFMIAVPHAGSVKIQNIDSYTTYSFTLTCTDADKPVPLILTTQVGRPSAPQSIAAALDSKRVRLTWAVPATPAGPINNYRIKVDQKPDLIEIPATDLFYVMKEDYVPGTKHTFLVQACNKDQMNYIICSPNNASLYTFGEETTTATATATTVTTTTIASTTKSMSRQSQGVSVALIAVCLFFFQWVL